MKAFYESREKPFMLALEEDSYSFPPHLHQQVELYYMLEGCREMEVGDSRCQLHAGDLGIAFPDQIHTYRMVNEGCRGIMLLFEPQLGGAYMHLLLNQQPQRPFVTADALHRDVDYLLKSLCNEQQEGGDPPVELVAAVTQVVLCRLMDGLALQKTVLPIHHTTTTALVAYLSKNFAQPLTLGQVAKELGLSRCYLSHVFSDKLQTSFSAYLNNLRLDYAKNLLRVSDKSVLEISMEAGFDSQRTFNRVFKAHSGLSPREYRRQ